MNTGPTFMDDWRAGRAGAEDINDHIAAWHDNRADHRTLHTALGMTWQQFCRWANDDKLPPRESSPQILAPLSGPLRLNTRGLYADVDAQRRRQGLSWRGVANQARHQTHSTIYRLGKGHAPTVEHVASLMWFVGTTDLAPYLLEERSDDE